MKHAKHHCCCLNMGSLQFSPKLNWWRECHLFWQLALQCHTSHTVKARYIWRLAFSCHISQPLGLSLLQVQAELSMADHMYSLLKRKHNLLHMDFLASCLVNPLLLAKHHKVIRHLVSLEALCDTYHQIWVIKNASAGKSILAVEFTTPFGTEITTSRVAVEVTLSTSLKTWFTRAHGSPFLKPPLAPLVGNFGTGKAAQEILEDTFNCPLELNKHTCQFIEALKSPLAEARQATVSLVLCPEDFIAHWKHAKEKTSSSPSGLHFGHYKLATYSPAIAHLHARFTQLIFLVGLSISRFQAGLQVILEKRLAISMWTICRQYCLWKEILMWIWRFLLALTWFKMLSP